MEKETHPFIKILHVFMKVFKNTQKICYRHLILIKRSIICDLLYKQTSSQTTQEKRRKKQSLTHGVWLFIVIIDRIGDSF